ncbi:hypothetical protein BGZ83_001065 [Gryganskiella cystojenkinii]|nr:hypothetical protein BGZ83_001065 [Gryganskiella cystojenkinii]
MITGKLFVGDLESGISSEMLRAYFSRFGKVGHCVAIRSPSAEKVKGYGFVNFIDLKPIELVLKTDHHIDGKKITVKRAIPPQEYLQTRTIYVDRIHLAVQESDIVALFSRFGPLLQATLVMTPDQMHHRGFAFVTFASEQGFTSALNSGGLVLCDSLLVVRRYRPPTLGTSTPQFQGKESLETSKVSSQDNAGPTKMVVPQVYHARLGTRKKMMTKTIKNLGERGGFANAEYWDTTRRLQQQAIQLERDVSAMMMYYQGPLPSGTPPHIHPHPQLPTTNLAVKQQLRRKKSMPTVIAAETIETEEDLIDLASSGDEKNWL